MRSLSGVESAVPRPVELLRVGHYHQSPHTQPTGGILKGGEECVEWVTGGRGWIRAGDIWREVVPGDLLWNGPGTGTIGRSDPANPYRCLSVSFRYRQRRASGLPRFSHWPEPAEALAFTAEACRLFSDETLDRALLRDYIFSRLRLVAARAALTPPASDLPPGIRTVLALMERDFSRSLPLSELSRAAGWSPAHLHAEFRRTLGDSPHQFLLRRRINAARERLIASRDPIKQIAVECGFADSAALAHAFRHATGSSPRTFREHHQRA